MKRNRICSIINCIILLLTFALLIIVLMTVGKLIPIQILEVGISIYTITYFVYVIIRVIFCFLSRK